MSEELEFDPIPVYDGKPIARKWIDAYNELKEEVELEREVRRKEKERREAKPSFSMRIRASVSKKLIEQKYENERFSKSSSEYKKRKEKDPNYESCYERLLKSRISLTDFKVYNRIGKGGFGDVHMVKHSETGEFLAMKVIPKEKCMGKYVLNVRLERDIMVTSFSSEWFVRMKYAFQDEKNLYFVMEYCQGGDFRGLIISKQEFTEYECAFYMAELILCIEVLHKNGLCHRDIKPGNILVDGDGHLKLADFGLCKPFENHSNFTEMFSEMFDIQEDTRRVRQRKSRGKFKRNKLLYTTHVGTPFYWPPEVLKKRGYNQACDWWSLGVIFFELLFQDKPFMAPTRKKLEAILRNWKVHFEAHLPRIEDHHLHNKGKESFDLLRNMICNARTRIGQPRGLSLKEVKEHPFFTKHNIDWKNIRNTTPPFVPSLKSESDTKYGVPDIFDKKKNLVLLQQEEKKVLTRKKFDDDSEAFFADISYRNLD